jgi:hypothetical protein
MTVIRKKGFTSGIRLDENKKSAFGPIQIFKIPSRVIIPLQQHIGSECEPLVKKGDIVFEGQLIGDSDKTISAAIHSSINGVVSGILKIVNPATSTIINAIEIKAHENPETNPNNQFPKTAEFPGTRTPGTAKTNEYVSAAVNAVSDDILAATSNISDAPDDIFEITDDVFKAPKGTANVADDTTSGNVDMFQCTNDDILASIDKIPVTGLLETIKKSGILYSLKKRG